MKTFYFVLILSLFILSSCKADKKTDVAISSSYIIDLDNVSSDTFKYSDIYSKVKAIVLDNQEILLNEITKLLVFQDNLFVLDSKAKALYVFDSEGRFIRQVGSLGPGPGEYSACTDFAIDTDRGEILILDSSLKKIFKYHSTDGKFIRSIRIGNQCDIDRIYWYEENLYGTKAGFISLSEPDTPMLYQLNATSGKLKKSWLDNSRHNKDWQGEYVRHNLFYSATDKCLFTMGFMDTIMQIKAERPIPYITLKSEGLVTKKDVSLMKEYNNWEVFHKMFQYNMQHKKIQNICNIFEYNEFLFFSFQRLARYQVRYNKITGETLIYDKTKDDLLYKESPSGYILPKFLLASENGVYYSTPIERVDELRHFIIEANLGSDKFVNKEILKDLNQDSNPVVLFYEFKE